MYLYYCTVLTSTSTVQNPGSELTQVLGTDPLVGQSVYVGICVKVTHKGVKLKKILS